VLEKEFQVVMSALKVDKSKRKGSPDSKRKTETEPEEDEETMEKQITMMELGAVLGAAQEKLNQVCLDVTMMGSSIGMIPQMIEGMGGTLDADFGKSKEPLVSVSPTKAKAKKTELQERAQRRRHQLSEQRQMDSKKEMTSEKGPDSVGNIASMVL